MLSWGAKRRLIISLAAIALAAVVIALSSVKLLYRPPSCTDGKQNQAEAGVDCGGPCQRLCENQGLAPLIHWQRAFPVSSGNYNAVAYVENKNVRSGASDVPYVFKLYDDNSILVAERTGTVNLSSHQVVPVFEPNISTGFRPPSRVIFVFDRDPIWTVLTADAPDVRTETNPPTDVETLPILTGKIINNSKRTLTHFDVVAIIYDADGNAQQASQTVVDSVRPHESASVSFSWPTPFDFVPARVEIIPKLYPGINY